MGRGPSTGSGLRVRDLGQFARRIAADEWQIQAIGVSDQIKNELIDYSRPPSWFHEGQKGVWFCHERYGMPVLEFVAVAGSQGGKTATQAPWLLREIQRCAPLIRKLGGGKFIYAGPTMTLLAEQALPALEDLFQDEEQLGKLVKGSKPKFHFSEQGLKRVLGFTGCDVTITIAYTNDSSNIESMTALGGVWDEVGQKENKRASYRAFNRRLKVARSITFGQIYGWLETEGLLEEFAWWIERYYDVEGPDARFGRRLWGTTPYEWNWFKSDIYDRAERGEPGYAFFNFPSWMNPLVSEAECRAELESGMDLWEWEMMYLGLFRRPAGLIYSGFGDHNKVPQFNPPKEWRRYVGMDFGNENTAAVILAEDPINKDLYVIAEYRKPASQLLGQNPYQAHARAIKDLAGCTPTGAGGSHQEDGWREAIRQHGIPLDEPPINDVETQISSVIAQVNTGALKVCKNCSGTIDQFESYRRELDDSMQPIDGTIVNKAAYHFLDSIRYVIQYIRPIQSRVSAPATRPAIKPQPQIGYTPR